MKIKAFNISAYLLIVFCCTGQNAFGQSAIAVEKVSLTVSDWEASTRFYTKVLDFKTTKQYKISGKAAMQFCWYNNPNREATHTNHNRPYCLQHDRPDIKFAAKPICFCAR